MKKGLLVLCLVAGVALSLALLWAGRQVGANGYTAQEAALNPAGEAYELNADAAGNLWVSDFGAGEIWHIHPATGVYTAYEGLSTPSDARPDGSGSVWWTDSDAVLWRLALGTGAATPWALPSGGAPLGTAIDTDGNVWVADSAQPLLYRFAPTTTELCSYALPGGATSNYIATGGTALWLSDYTAYHMMRLEPASGEFTMWELPWTSYINGIAVDGEGDVWVAESASYSLLAELDPVIDRLTAYTLPVGTWPEMLALHDDLVWYSEDDAGTVGVLDPSVAAGATYTLSSSTQVVTPTCSTLVAGISATLDTRSGTAVWATSSLSTTVASGGWTVFSLPDGGAPWGIAVAGSEAFVVDKGRQLLLRIAPPGVDVYLPLVVRQEP